MFFNCDHKFDRIFEVSSGAASYTHHLEAAKRLLCAVYSTVFALMGDAKQQL
jgi:hypothetical protein